MATFDTSENVQQYLDKKKSDPITATQGSVDVTDRVARLLGHVRVDNTIPISDGGGSVTVDGDIVVQSFQDGVILRFKDPSDLELAGEAYINVPGTDISNKVLSVASKKLAASTYSPSLFKNLGTLSSGPVKLSAGNVFSLSCHNTCAVSKANGYIQLHNTTSALSGASVPLFSFYVPPNCQIVIGTDLFTNEGCNFSTGITFGYSTTPQVFTAGTAGNHLTWIQYK